MQYRRVGQSGLYVSVISLGSWYTLGTAVDEAESLRIIRTAYDAGINCFDTANVYTREWGSGAGDVEKLLGRALRELPRSSYVIVDKLGGRMGSTPNEIGRGGKYLKEQCEASLRRLGMDYLDLCLCHRPMPGEPIEDTVLAMEDLARQGKILYWGVSNWAPWRIVKAQGLARERHYRPMVAVESRYNLLFRFPELELFPATEEEGVGHLVYSPLAQGMLTGKYAPGQPPPPDSRAADDHFGKYMRRLYYSEENKQRTTQLARLAAEHGLSAGELAIAWTLRHPRVSTAIIGARTVEQVKQNVRAADVRLPPAVEMALDQLFPVRRDLWLREGEIPDLQGGTADDERTPHA